MCREGLTTRTVASSSDEIQLRIDPMQGDLDDHISGLRGQVKQLRNVCLFSILFLEFVYSYLSSLIRI